MNYSEKQKLEIQSIKPRTFILNLSDADVVRIFEKAGQEGITPDELLENFIGDLVCGTHSNGSDERMYANEWFDRCYFCGENNFLKYVLNWNDIESVAELIDDIDESENEIHILKDDDKNYDEERKYFCLLLSESRAELISIFNNYCKSNVKHESLADAMDEIRLYMATLNCMLNENFDE